MWKKIKEFFKKAWDWIEAVWEKHDDVLEEMVSAILPLVISVAFQNNLSGDEKRKAVIDAILDNAEVAGSQIAVSMLNEAVEIAANRYNIQIGKLTVAGMDFALDAATKAARDFANNKLDITGEEAESAGVSMSDANTP